MPKCSKSKKKFFDDMVRQVKEADPSKWYSMLKRITNYHKDKTERLDIEERNHLTDKDQAEAIADGFNTISQEYEEVKKENIAMPEIHDGTILKFEPWQIKKYLDRIKSRIQETLNLSTDADHRTDIYIYFFFVGQVENFFWQYFGL